MSEFSNQKFTIRPIGVIHSPHRRPQGTPIQPQYAGDAAGTVEIDERYAAGLRDLEGFDRLWLIYWFDRAPEPRMVVTPFMDSEPRGLFATRAPCRPNPIGMSPVRLERIEGNVLHVRGIDVLDGTPLLDVKPYAPRFDHYPVARSGWLDEADTRRTVADRRFAADADDAAEEVR